ncbi:MAG: hypothetical protein BA867_09645 [Desulfobacterales bacterium S5133MH16]|nr:MAG: hypothetical protein BA867_09645 [Desulfobacterales bacterium S5133MH16]
MTYNTTATTEIEEQTYKPIPTTKSEMINAINELSNICCRVKAPTPWQASAVHMQIGKLRSLAENWTE